MRSVYLANCSWKFYDHENCELLDTVSDVLIQVQVGLIGADPHVQYVEFSAYMKMAKADDESKFGPVVKLKELTANPN